MIKQDEAVEESPNQVYQLNMSSKIVVLTYIELQNENDTGRTFVKIRNSADFAKEKQDWTERGLISIFEMVMITD